MKTVSVNFQEDILKNLDELASKLGTSRSNALMIVLRECDTLFNRKGVWKIWQRNLQVEYN